MVAQTAEGEELIATIKNAAGLILAVTENRNWIEVFFEGDLMHTQTVNLPAGRMFDVYIEEDSSQDHRLRTSPHDDFFPRPVRSSNHSGRR